MKEKLRFLRQVLLMMHRAPNFVFSADKTFMEVGFWTPTLYYYFSVKGPLCNIFLRPWVLQAPFRWFRLPFDPEKLLLLVGIDGDAVGDLTSGEDTAYLTVDGPFGAFDISAFKEPHKDPPT